MFERLSNGLELATQSFRVLKLDKELLIFPLLSGLGLLLVLSSFVIPLWNSEHFWVVLKTQQVPDDPLAYALLFAFYFANYFLIVFFNAALIGCAIIRFRGGDPTLGDGLRAASARLPQIIGWALVSATVGLILRIVESRLEKVGRFVAGLFGMVWSVATYFVVPVLVVEKLGPAPAIKRSAAILRKAWGEALAANFGIGLVVFLATLASVIPVVLGFLLGSAATAIAGSVVTALLLILISLTSAAVSAISVGALYLYAAEGIVPQQFDGALLRHAFVGK